MNWMNQIINEEHTAFYIGVNGNLRIVTSYPPEIFMSKREPSLPVAADARRAVAFERRLVRRLISKTRTRLPRSAAVSAAGFRGVSSRRTHLTGT
jgi:hypothetical protein